MKFARTMIFGGLTACFLGSVLPMATLADDVSDPQAVFGSGMQWIERNGENKGVMQLYPRGGAVVNWNGTTYWGRWEKIDEYHVKTTWEHGGPEGSVWSLRATGDDAIPYVASRRTP